MSKVPQKVLGVILGGPTTLLMACVTVALGLVGVAAWWPLVIGAMEMMRGPAVGRTLSEWGTLTIAALTLVAVSGMFFWLSWCMGMMTRDMGAGVAGGARGVARATRKAIDVRAQKAERMEAQGGQISLSVGDGAGGGLSQVAPGKSGLELVERDEVEPVVLDLVELDLVALGLAEHEESEHA